MLNDEPTITANADQSDQPLSEDYIRDRKVSIVGYTRLDFSVALNHEPDSVAYKHYFAIPCSCRC